ncbi:MAG: hypothetical protein ACRC0X_03000, partial [Brevinema sp.]
IILFLEARVYRYFLILLFIPYYLYSYTMMFDMSSNTFPVVDRGEEYITIDFQPALIPYRAVFQSSQTKRLLSAIKKYKEYQQKSVFGELESYEKLMTLTFHLIEDRKRNVASQNPSLTIYFLSSGNKEQLLVFSIGRIQKETTINPEIFYLTQQGIEELEEMLQNSYLAKK